MKKQELLSILITFVVGFFAGGFLYLNVFTQMVAQDTVQSVDEQSEFSITSQAYGGCRNDCPAFRVNADGTFRYQYSPSVGAEPVLRSGTLPRSIRRDLERDIRPSEISTQTERVSGQNCSSQADGIDIEYTITLNGAIYTLDSCRTAVDADSDSWQALSSVWTYFTELSREQ